MCERDRRSQVLLGKGMAAGCPVAGWWWLGGGVGSGCWVGVVGRGRSRRWVEGGESVCCDVHVPAVVVDDAVVVSAEQHQFPWPNDRTASQYDRTASSTNTPAPSLGRACANQWGLDNSESRMPGKHPPGGSSQQAFDQAREPLRSPLPVVAALDGRRNRCVRAVMADGTAASALWRQRSPTRRIGSVRVPP